MKKLNPCRICEGKAVFEYGWETIKEALDKEGVAAWVECECCGDTDTLENWNNLDIIDSPLRFERDALRRVVERVKEKCDELHIDIDACDLSMAIEKIIDVEMEGLKNETNN